MIHSFPNHTLNFLTDRRGKSILSNTDRYQGHRILIFINNVACVIISVHIQGSEVFFYLGPCHASPKHLFWTPEKNPSIDPNAEIFSHNNWCSACFMTLFDL